MKWLLIYWIVVTYNHPVTTGSVGFADEQSCKQAFAKMRETKAYFQGLWGVCVPDRQQQP